jgi:hypothetical protein
MARKSFAASLGGFIGRMIVKIGSGFISSICRALVLAYPVKWIWNDLRNLLGLQEVISLLDYWTAFKLLLIICFFFIEKFEAKTSQKEEE